LTYSKLIRQSPATQPELCIIAEDHEQRLGVLHKPESRFTVPCDPSLPATTGDIAHTARCVRSGKDLARSYQPPVPRQRKRRQHEHPSSSIQHKQLAAAQGSLLSPLTKNGSISLYSRIFTVASLGALPCAIARNACSDCATIARARSFLWIEWYLDGIAQCSSGMT
jgi:hypothetical protein